MRQMIHPISAQITRLNKRGCQGTYSQRKGRRPRQAHSHGRSGVRAWPRPHRCLRALEAHHLGFREARSLRLRALNTDGLSIPRKACRYLNSPDKSPDQSETSGPAAQSGPLICRIIITRPCRARQAFMRPRICCRCIYRRIGLRGQMPRRKRWPAERVRQLEQLWADPTQTVSGIARALGVSRPTVLWRAKLLGLKGRPTDRAGRWPNELTQ